MWAPCLPIPWKFAGHHSNEQPWAFWFLLIMVLTLLVCWSCQPACVFWLLHNHFEIGLCSWFSLLTILLSSWKIKKIFQAKFLHQFSMFFFQKYRLFFQGFGCFILSSYLFSLLNLIFSNIFCVHWSSMDIYCY